MTTETRFVLISELQENRARINKKLDICYRGFNWALAMWNKDSNAGNYFSPFRRKTDAWTARIKALNIIYTMYGKELLKLLNYEN